MGGAQVVDVSVHGACTKQGLSIHLLNGQVLGILKHASEH